MKKISNLICIIFTVVVFSQQKTVKGTIKDNSNNPVIGCSVLLKNFKNKIISYAISKNQGVYQMTFNTKQDSLWLVVNSLGFQSQKALITFKENTIIKKNFILSETNNELEEIVVESKRKIVVKKDTIIYRISSYTNETEETVEDVLKKLPGISVEDDGKISYAGKEIDKILIEGDDLASNNYKLLSRNLDARLLKNVEVLKNYEDNPLVKKFENSKKVAINLNIKNDQKNKWFSNINTGIGHKKKYNIRYNLGLLKKKIKLLSLNKLNNNGYNVTSQSNNSLSVDLNSFQLKEPKALSIINNNTIRIGNLKLYESLLNNSKLSSLSSISKLNTKTKIRTLFYISDEDVDFMNNTEHRYLQNNISFKEIKSDKKSTKELYGDIELTTFNNKNWHTSFQSKWLHKNISNTNYINTNSNVSKELLTSKKRNFFNHFKITYSPNKRILWQNYLYLTKSQNTENNHFINSLLFLKSYQDTISQNNTSSKSLLGLNSKINFKKGNSNFAYNFTIENQHNKIVSTIQTKNQSNNSLTINSKQRFLNVNNNITYTYNVSDKTKLNTNASLNFKSILDTKQTFKLPKIAIGINTRTTIGYLSLHVGLSKQLFNSNNLFNGFLIKGYRNLYYNNAILDIVTNKKINFSHIVNYADRGFYSYTFGAFSKRNKSLLITEKITKENSVYENSIINKENNYININNKTTRYFHNLKTSFTLTNDFQMFENYTQNVANSITKFTTYTHNIELKARTYFRIPVNFTFYINKSNNWNIYTNEKKLISTNSFGLVADYTINNQVHFSSKLNHYRLKSNKHNFLSAVITYKPLKSNLNYKIKAHNLCNVTSYFQSNSTGFSNYFSSTEIIPRYIMLQVNYRF